MASKNQISQWTQQQQSTDAQKKLINKLKLEGANMLKDIYEAILHIKDYCETLKKAIHISQKQNEEKEIKIVLREDCKPLNYFCQCLERVLLFGYKKKFFRSSSIWSFICDSTAKCLPMCQQLATDINLIKSIEVLNEDGKTRAFLRQALRSKLIPLYFKLMQQQHEVIQDYYWDFGVMSQQNQAIALLAQLDELNYIPSNVEFCMLLSDKSLNIIENFRIDDYGVPQWNIKQERGDINMMTDIWLLKNRDNIGIDINVKKTKKPKKKSKPKRKLNSLLSTDDVFLNNDNDENIKLQIRNINDSGIKIINHVDEHHNNDRKVEKSKKKKKKKRKDEKSKRKKKKRKKKKHKNINEAQSLLKKQEYENTTVIDDSEYIQNILEKDKLQKQTQSHPEPPPQPQSQPQPQISPAAFLRTTPKASPKILHINDHTNDMDELNIDDIIDEHFEKEEKKAKIDHDIKLLTTPNKTAIIEQTQSTPNSITTSPKPIPKNKVHKSQLWFRRHRSSSVGESKEFQPHKKPSIKPNNFIKGTSASNRPYEIIVIHRRKQSKNIVNNGSSTPPPRTLHHRQNRHKKNHNRRYLQVNKTSNISQSSSPTISIQHKIIRNENPEDYRSHRHKSHLKYMQQNQNDNHQTDDDDEDESDRENDIKIIHNGNKKPRSNSSIIESPKPKPVPIQNEHAPDVEVNNEQKTDEKKVNNFAKPKLSKKAKEFVTACSTSHNINSDENIQIKQSETDKIDTNHQTAVADTLLNEEENKQTIAIEPSQHIENIIQIQTHENENESESETVKEVLQTRENDEYDTEEDTQQTTTTYYQPFSGNIYLAASEPAQYLDQYLPSILTQSRTRPIATPTNKTPINEYNSHEEEEEEEEDAEHTDSETKRIKLRKKRDESLRRSAMELDRAFSVPKQSMLYKPQNIGRSTSQFVLYDINNSDSEQRVKRTQSSGGIHDIIEHDEKQSNLSSIFAKLNDNNNNNTIESNHANDSSEIDDFFESPIPKEQKDRFSKFMTEQYVRKKRAESEDLTGTAACFDHESPNYLTSPYFNKKFNNNSINASPSNSMESSITKSMYSHINTTLTSKRIPTAIFAHSELKQEGGPAVRDQIKNQDWHSGIEISWRTTPLPVRDNNALLLEQNFHCATCGLVLKSNFLRRAKYHYCRYLGLIHCNECHKNERAVIPHRVLHELDCKPATVCCSAKTYLDQMYNIPCITLDEFGSDEKVQSHKKIKQLTKILFELKAIKKYLEVCRDKNELLDDIYKEYRHWIRHAGALSLRDCVNIVMFNTGDKLQVLSNKLQKHIQIDCDMCRGKGSYCEICNSQTVIYLFQYQQVEQCQVCKACFHVECWMNANKDCPRCKRRRKVAPQIK